MAEEVAVTADTAPAVPLEPGPANWREEDAAEAGRQDRCWFDRDED